MTGIVPLAHVIECRPGYPPKNITSLTSSHSLCTHILTHTHFSYNRGLIRRRRCRRAPQVFRPFPDLATMEERDVIKKYRLDTHTIMDLCTMLEVDLLPKNRNPTAISPIVKILASLHFFATGSFQNTVSVSGGMSQPTFSVVLDEVLFAVVKHMDTFIHLPKHDELNGVKADFYAYGHIPHVVGVIDCTHIAFVPPSHRGKKNTSDGSSAEMNVRHSASVQRSGLNP